MPWASKLEDRHNHHHTRHCHHQHQQHYQHYVATLTATSTVATTLRYGHNNQPCHHLLWLFALVGEPKTINTHVLDNFKESDITPVIAPIGIGLKGETLNVNADTAAGAIASALNARRLLMLTDVAGVLDSNGELIATSSAKGTGIETLRATLAALTTER